MKEVIYEIVQHDGGWAYKSNGVFSETFPDREAALQHAQLAAAEQTRVGDDEEIEYEDENSHWKIEHADGYDRPKTKVVH